MGDNTSSCVSRLLREANERTTISLGEMRAQEREKQKRGIEDFLVKMLRF